MYDYLVISMGYDGDWEISYYAEDRDEAKKVFESRWSRFAFRPIIVLGRIDKRNKERSKYIFYSDEIVILDVYVSEKIEDDFDIYSYIGKTIKRLADDLESYWGRRFSVARMSKMKKLNKIRGKKMKKVARDFRVSVRDGEIWGYTERGTKAFRISEVAEGVYEAENYLGGWISPKLDILGAWNLAQDVGVTVEEFERAFGKLPDSMTVDFDEFVSWFFRVGQLPKGVIIDTGVGENLLQMVIEGIEEQVLYDLEERLAELGEEIDRDIARSVVFDYVMYIGLYEAIDRMSDEEVLEYILEPVFGDYIEIDKRNKTVTLNTKEFFEFANTHEAAMGLIEALQDVLDSYLYERYDVDKLVNLYGEK